MPDFSFLIIEMIIGAAILFFIGVVTGYWAYIGEEK